MAGKPLTPFRLVQLLLRNSFALAEFLIRSWRIYAEIQAARRNAMLKWCNTISDHIQKYEKGEEDLNTVKLALKAIRQDIDKDNERDSYIVEYLSDIFRMTEKSKSKINALTESSKLSDALRVNHDFTKKFVARREKLCDELDRLKQNNNPPKKEN